MADALRTILDETTAIRTELEQKRERYLRIFILIAPMSVAAVCAVGALNMDRGVFPWQVVSIVSVIACLMEFLAFDALYRKLTKKALLGKIAVALNLTYDRNGTFPVGAFERHQILPAYDIHHIEDGFSGTVNGISLSFEETRLSERYKDDDGKWQERPVFWGLLVRIGIGKQLANHTIVMPHNRINSFFRTTLSKYEPVHLVSPKFKERFDVIATDQVEARYVLDPAFMERFLEADDLAATKWLSASFIDREIAIAIQRFKPMFEIGRLWKPLNEKTIAATVAELTLILNMIETLKLNPHTGLGAPLPRSIP